MACCYDLMSSIALHYKAMSGTVNGDCYEYFNIKEQMHSTFGRKKILICNDLLEFNRLKEKDSQML